MNKILLAVDVQPEFADKDGHYGRILDFIQNSRYDEIVATQCVNSPNSAWVKYQNWTNLMDGAKPLEFDYDRKYEKKGYGMDDYSVLKKDAHYDIIGFNTGACVLKVALDLFDRGYDFNVLADYCYSDSGADHHKKGLWTLNNLLGNAVLRSGAREQGGKS